ncbi:hypothetical protein [Dyadobacter flavalbus]|nr:hypothetical protein [Dyadobacter flavalbus]
MIILAKLTLFTLWIVTFVITCLVMGIVFPFVTLFDNLENVFAGSSVQ